MRADRTREDFQEGEGQRHKNTGKTYSESGETSDMLWEVAD